MVSDEKRGHGVVECSFGPIGRSGGRAVIPGFGPQMKDFDGRDLEVYALYHKTHADPNLNGHAAGDPFYWEFSATTESLKSTIRNALCDWLMPVRRFANR